MQDVWRENRGVGFWDSIFIRYLNDWEVDEVGRPLLWLGPKKLCVVLGDKPRWMEAKSGDFSTKAMYMVGMEFF